jgi:hypothetical protein
VIPIRVEDPIELELPPLGLVAVEDLELGEEGGDLFVALDRRSVGRYRDQVARERALLDALLRKLRLDSMSIRCGSDWQAPLVAFFRQRARKLKR